MTVKDESIRLEAVRYATGEEQRALTTGPKTMKWQSRNSAQLWMCLLLKAKHEAVKKSMA